VTARISELEAEITSEKIVDQVAGTLQAHPQLEGKRIDAIEAHVAKVLTTNEFSQLLPDRREWPTQERADTEL
jgi:hypothetical protein